MKKGKILLAFLLTLVMAVGVLTGCGADKGDDAASSTGTNEQTDENEQNEDSTEENADTANEDTDKADSTEDGETIQIAMIMYDWADDQGQYLQQCGAYMEENFNVKFEYVSTGTEAEEVISTVENLCSKGVDGIMNAMTQGFQSWAQICEDKGVYYTVLLNTIDKDDEAFVAGCNYFAGSAHRSEYTQLGKDYAQQVLDGGFKNVLFAAFAEGMLNSNDQMVVGFKEVMDAQDDITYKVINAYPQDLFASITAELAGGNYDGILTSVSVMDFGVGNIFAGELVGQVRAIGHNIDPSTDEAFGAGIVAYITDNLTGIVNMNFVMLVNAIEGNELLGTPDGYWNIEVPSIVLGDAESLATYREYVRSTDDDSKSTYAFTADEMKRFIVSYNSDASYDEFKAYIEETTVEAIAERHQ